ncbi:hypothetical protein MKW98_001619 [Papaver atlanticum]|uniref:Uncharacterized protein n=1 Tax=Papaver atlanticum TaxID=357466 RepID=A0AAD4S886_9MAGN|nr:hypothetical protein MKW98_001619 [Papaver atlanticum]
MASSSLILSQVLPKIYSSNSHRFKSFFLSYSFPSSSSSVFISSCKSLSQIQRFCSVSTKFSSNKKPFTVSASSNTSTLLALIFDCDGVILESEHLHRQAYNDAFAHFNDWKTERYKEIIKSGTVEPRPGVLRLMDEAKTAGIKLAVCSAATKSSVILCLESLIGNDRFKGLDCFLAGDDVKQKKPDPSIYITAAKSLGVPAESCMVVEDSVIGLQAATGAGMPCVVSYTSSTSNQDFTDAIAIYPDLSNVSLENLELLLQNRAVAK